MTVKKLTDPEQIGLRIRAARTRQNMSQTELAEKADIALPTLNAIENGRSKMLVTSFVRIVEALQVSSDSLLMADIPSVNAIYQNQFSELFEDCSPAEMEMLMSTIRNLKATMRNMQNNS